MAVVVANPDLGAQIVEDAKEYVLYSWSTQNAINPIPAAGAEGRYFWDYDGKRYLDFASQLVNLIGHQHPKILAAIREQAEKLCTVASNHGERDSLAYVTRMEELGVESTPFPAAARA